MTFAFTTKTRTKTKAKESSTNNEDAAASPQRLSPEELRRLRLAALGAAPLETNNNNNESKENMDQSSTHAAVPPNQNDMIDLLDDDDGDSSCSDENNDDENDRKLSTAEASAAAIKRKEQVLDLIDSSDDEDVDNPVAAARRARQQKWHHQTAAVKKQKTATNAPDSTVGRHFQVATYNVWFGKDPEPHLMKGEPHPGPRMRSLSQILLDQHQDQNPLWFVGFQEVVEETACVLGPAMEKSGYRRLIREPDRGNRYGCAIAVHSSLQILEHDWVSFRVANMGRGFLYVRAKLPFSSTELLFTTTHLESFVNKDEYDGSAQRPPQLRQMEQFCLSQLAQRPNLKAAIMTGDLNWDDELPKRGRRQLRDQPVASVLGQNWMDTWLETRPSPDATCYTYDGKNNPMLRNSNRFRLDRILVRGSVRPLSTKLLGEGVTIPDLKWERQNPFTGTTTTKQTAPSDHFGVVASLEMLTMEGQGRTLNS